VLRVYDSTGRELSRIRLPGTRTMAFARRGHGLALVRERPATGQHEIVLLRAERRARPRRLFAGMGAITELAWSPDGRWLLASWLGADQWVLIRSQRVRGVLTLSGVSQELPAPDRDRGLTTIEGWCCPP
jgi:hypothetical protein